MTLETIFLQSLITISLPISADIALNFIAASNIASSISLNSIIEAEQL